MTKILERVQVLKNSVLYCCKADTLPKKCITIKITYYIHINISATFIQFFWKMHIIICYNKKFFSEFYLRKNMYILFFFYLSICSLLSGILLKHMRSKKKILHSPYRKSCKMLFWIFLTLFIHWKKILLYRQPYFVSLCVKIIKSLRFYLLLMFAAGCFFIFPIEYAK